MSPGVVPEWNQDYYTNYITIGYSELRRSPTLVYQSGFHSGLTFFMGEFSAQSGYVGMHANLHMCPLQLHVLILHPCLFT